MDCDILKVVESISGTSSEKIDATSFDRFYGRVCFGAIEANFESLHRDGIEKKPLSWVLSNDGFELFLNGKAKDSKSVRYALHAIGVDDGWIRNKLTDGNRFRLALFRSDQAVRADWNGIFELVKKHFSSVAAKVESNKQDLMTFSYTDIQDIAKEEYLRGATYVEIHEYFGEEDDRYISTKKLQELEGSLAEVRGWLYHTLGLNKFFSGDGFTTFKNGVRGYEEYIVPNVPVKMLPSFHWIDLEIDPSDVLTM